MSGDARQLFDPEEFEQPFTEAEPLSEPEPIPEPAAATGPGPDPDSGTACGADIVAGQRARRQIGGRCEHCPNQNAPLRIADIDTEFVDRAGVELSMPRRRRKGAAEPL